MSTVETPPGHTAAPQEPRPAVTELMKRHLIQSQTGWLVGVLVVIIAVFTVLSPSQFLSAANLQSIVMNAAVLVVLAIGMTYVITTAGIDLSVGAILVFAQVIAAKVIGSWETTPFVWVMVVGVGVSIVSGLAWGIVNGVLIGIARVPPFVTTLGTLGAAGGAALLLTDGVNVGSPVSLQTDFGNKIVLGIPVVGICAGVLALIAGIFLAQSRFGRYTIAIGSNERGASRAGVNVPWHLIRVYALSGALAGLAGFLSLSQYSNTTIAGHASDNLNAVAAVVIGGTSLFGGRGTILGSVIGVFVPAVLLSGFVLEGLQPFWQQIAVGAVLVFAVFLDQRRRARLM